MRMSGLAPSSLVGSSTTVENTLAVAFESTPVHGDRPPRCGAVKFRPPLVSKIAAVMPGATMRSRRNESVGYACQHGLV
jgi:hypothetical protein